MKEIQWQSLEGSFIGNASDANYWIELCLTSFALEVLVEAEMSQKLSWRDMFVQIELGVDIASLGIK